MCNSFRIKGNAIKLRFNNYNASCKGYKQHNSKNFTTKIQIHVKMFDDTNTKQFSKKTEESA